jgi:predicted small integral membrane protein
LPCTSTFDNIRPKLRRQQPWPRYAPGGGGPRRGILGLDTTRGDRLFISLLGSAFIHLGWLAFAGQSPWRALAISVVFAVAVFRWV